MQYVVTYLFLNGNWYLFLDNNIQSVDSIGRMLETNQTLTTLDLSCNRIKILELIMNGLEKNEYLRELDLHSKNFHSIKSIFFR